MLYREIIAVCSEIHTKHINTAVWAERRVCETVGLKVLNRLTRINDVCKDMTPCSLPFTLQKGSGRPLAHNTHDIAAERVGYHGILIVPFPTTSNSNMADVR